MDKDDREILFRLKPPLAERAPLSESEVGQLVGLYKVLASDTRLRLLHEIERAGEIGSGALAEQVAMAPQAVSNQLQRLVDQGIVGNRRDGTRSFYRITMPCVTTLLEVGLCLLEELRQPADLPTSDRLARAAGSSRAATAGEAR